MIADEAERLFSFAESRGVFDVYLPELTGRSTSQRDSALSELRVAFYFDRNGFRVSDWRPVGNPPKEGEFTIVGPDGESIFVEVKSPGWESELSQAERISGRTKQEKYLNGEGRTAANDEAITFAVDKAYGKFSDRLRNLLVVVDDLFISLRHGTDSWARAALYNPHRKGRFTSPSNDRLGGVSCFWWETNDRDVRYEMPLFVNPYALAPCSLPSVFVEAFHGRSLTFG
jgi:hypothetical protein